MIINISPRYVWMRYEEWPTGALVIDSDDFYPPKPNYITYKMEMRSRELDKGYKGRWMK